jgi:titin
MLLSANKPHRQIEKVISMSLQCADKPSAPGLPEITTMQKGTAMLRWARPQSDGGTPITTFRVERRTIGAYLWEVCNPNEKVTETAYTVTGLQPDTDYEFRILAENKVGVSQPSAASRTAKYGTFVLYARILVEIVY